MSATHLGKKRSRLPKVLKNHLLFQGMCLVFFIISCCAFAAWRCLIMTNNTTAISSLNCCLITGALFTIAGYMCALGCAHLTQNSSKLASNANKTQKIQLAASYGEAFCFIFMSCVSLIYLSLGATEPCALNAVQCLGSLFSILAVSCWMGHQLQKTSVISKQSGCNSVKSQIPSYLTRVFGVLLNMIGITTIALIAANAIPQEPALILRTIVNIGWAALCAVGIVLMARNRTQNKENKSTGTSMDNIKIEAVTRQHGTVFACRQKAQ